MLLIKAFHLQLLQRNQDHSSADVSRINAVWKHLVHCGHNFNRLHHINWKWLNCFASAEDDCAVPFSPWPADWLTNAPTSLAGHQSALALSLVNTRVLTHTYTVKHPTHIMSSTGAVLPSEATGSRHDEGSPDQLQLFHLKQSIASKTLIHYQKCMDKIVKYKRKKKKRYIDRHNMRTVRQSYFVCIIALMWAIKPKWIWFYCLPYIQCDRCHDQYLWFVSHQPSMA